MAGRFGGPACCPAPIAGTAECDFVPADKDNSRSVHKAEDVRADGVYAATCVTGTRLLV